MSASSLVVVVIFLKFAYLKPIFHSVLFNSKTKQNSTIPTLYNNTVDKKNSAIYLLQELKAHSYMHRALR